MKVMISQPMNGRTEEQIKEERKRIVDNFEKMHIEVINTLFTEEAPEDCNIAVYYLGKSISAMKDIDAIYMCDNWRKARGCLIEHEVARRYGIKILYSNFFDNIEPNNIFINTREIIGERGVKQNVYNRIRNNMFYNLCNSRRNM